MRERERIMQHHPPSQCMFVGMLCVGVPVLTSSRKSVLGVFSKAKVPHFIAEQMFQVRVSLPGRYHHHQIIPDLSVEAAAEPPSQVERYCQKSRG